MPLIVIKTKPTIGGMSNWPLRGEQPFAPTETCGELGGVMIIIGVTRYL